MVITNGYCTEAELRDWNRSNSTATTALLEQAIEACSRGIDRFCERTFYQSTGARVFDACEGYDENGRWVQTIELGGHNEVTTVTAVKTDDNADGTFETTWAASDYQLLPLNATAGPEAEPYTQLRAIGSRRFPIPRTGRVGLVQITGTPWGWPGIPSGVNQACKMHAARIFNRKESPQGVAGWGEFGAIRVGRTDPDVIAFLEPYQYYGVGFA